LADDYALLETPRRGPQPPLPSVRQANLSACNSGKGKLGASAAASPAKEGCDGGGDDDDDDFYDAQSEAEDEPSAGPTGVRTSPPRASPSRSPGGGPAAPYAKRGDEVNRRLCTLLDIERRCRGLPGGGAGEGLEALQLEVESVLKEDSAQLWFAHSKSCPFVIGCLRCLLPLASVRDAVQAIQSPRQRMAWDGDSFTSFDVLRDHDVTDPTREDVVFTVMPAPSPVRDREILQWRWQVALGSDGAQALIMQSFQDDTLRPPHPQRVRAFTHLSGYLLRPLNPEACVNAAGAGGGAQGGIEVVVISQCDLGGALPGWFQNMARRLAKRRCLAWGQKLQGHCVAMAQERGTPAEDKGATAARHEGP